MTNWCPGWESDYSRLLRIPSKMCILLKNNDIERPLKSLEWPKTLWLVT
jgi:hypothetical protein